MLTFGDPFWRKFTENNQEVIYWYSIIKRLKFVNNLEKVKSKRTRPVAWEIAEASATLKARVLLPGKGWM